MPSVREGIGLLPRRRVCACSAAALLHHAGRRGRYGLGGSVPVSARPVASGPRPAAGAVLLRSSTATCFTRSWCLK